MSGPFTMPRTDDEIVERFRDHPHYRIGYMESALVGAQESLQALLRLLPTNPSSEQARAEIEGRLAAIARALRLAGRADKP